jgi:predicted phosphoribosyltransferase
MKEESRTIVQLARDAGQLDPAPTLLVGLGGASLSLTRDLAGRMKLPWALSVSAGICPPGSAVLVGIVSGTDDASFWNEQLVSDLDLDTEDLQHLAKTGRLNAIKDAHNIRSHGARLIPPELYAENVIVISSGAATTSIRYELCLLRNRKPAHVSLALTPSVDSAPLVANGLVDAVF